MSLPRRRLAALDAAGIPEDVDPVGDPYVLGLLHKDRAAMRGYLAELRLALRRPAGPPAERKLLMVGRARSGTTLLVRLLNQVPAIRCDAEVLHYAVRDPRRHLNRLAEAAGAPVYGCKLLSYQMLEVQALRDPAAFLAALAEDGFRFVHVVRDTFEQSLSLSTAQLTRRYHRAAGARAETPRVTLEPGLFARQLRWNAALLEFENRLMAGFDHIRINYDRDLADSARHQSTVDRICAFVGVESGAVIASLQKIRQGAPSDEIANFAEVEAELRRCGLGGFVRT